MNTAIPYEKPFADFLRYVYETYPKSAFPESYVPIIAHKATAGYAVEKCTFPSWYPNSSNATANSSAPFLNRAEKFTAQYPGELKKAPGWLI
ncbi:MAG: hypothetical protein U1F16_09540 [Turneriella sp.]